MAWLCLCGPFNPHHCPSLLGSRDGGLHPEGWEKPEVPLSPGCRPTGVFTVLAEHEFSCYSLVRHLPRVFWGSFKVESAWSWIHTWWRTHFFFFLSLLNLFWAQRAHVYIVDAHKLIVSPWRTSLGGSVRCVTAVSYAQVNKPCPQFQSPSLLLSSLCLKVSVLNKTEMFHIIPRNSLFNGKTRSLSLYFEMWFPCSHGIKGSSPHQIPNCLRCFSKNACI